MLLIGVDNFGARWGIKCSIEVSEEVNLGEVRQWKSSRHHCHVTADCLQASERKRVMPGFI
jgi:hypothetical protein